MSYAPGAPAQIWAIPNDVLDAGAKLTYMAMWSKADHDAQRHPEPTTVWFAGVLDATPAMSLLIGIATMTGAKVRAVRGHLTKLRALGVVDTCGRLVTLTPGCHACHRGGELCHCGVDTRMAEFDAVTARPDAVVSDSAAVVSLQLDPPVPSSPLSPGEDARPTSGKPANGTRPLDTRLPAKQPSRHTRGPGAPELPGHVARELARAKREQAPAPGSKLSDEWRLAIRAHDQGWWYPMLDHQKWCDALAEASGDLAFELPQALRVLDAWRAETRDGVPDECPERRSIWYTAGPPGWLARKWLRRALASTRWRPGQVIKPRQTLEEAQEEAWR